MWKFSVCSYDNAYDDMADGEGHYNSIVNSCRLIIETCTHNAIIYSVYVVYIHVHVC